MFNAATIVIRDDMTEEEIAEALSQDASVILDAREKPVTMFVPELIARYHMRRKLGTTPQIDTTNRPKEIEI